MQLCCEIPFVLWFFVAVGWAQQYFAWIKVSLPSTNIVTDGRPEGRSDVGKLYLAKIGKQNAVTTASLNTLICQIISECASKKEGKLMVEGTRIGENTYDGTISQLVQAIHNKIREKYLLDPEPLESFVDIKVVNEGKMTSKFPMKHYFDVTVFYVNDEPARIICPLDNPVSTPKY